MINRRQFSTAAMLAAAAAALPCRASAAGEGAAAKDKTEAGKRTGAKAAGDGSTQRPFALHYIVASCMYGTAPLAEIAAEVRKTGAAYLEIWDRPHGNQREQIDAMGEPAFLALLDEHQIRLGSFTCFRQGIFQMQEEMRVVKRLGGDMVICNSGGPAHLEGDELKTAVHKFAEQLRPHVAAAEQIGVILGVENHGNSLIQSADSQRMLLDAIDSPHLGIALAPYHLPQDAAQIGRLIEQLGPRLVHFQAWQHGKGCHRPMPKEDELLQMPGRGDLDFGPLLAALEKIEYRGRTEIFMHPTPRGIAILDSTAAVTAEINRARHYLEKTLQQQRGLAR